MAQRLVFEIAKSDFLTLSEYPFEETMAHGQVGWVNLGGAQLQVYCVCSSSAASPIESGSRSTSFRGRNSAPNS